MMNTSSQQQDSTTELLVFVENIPSERLRRAIVRSLQGPSTTKTLVPKAYRLLGLNLDHKHRQIVINRIWSEVDFLLEQGVLEEYQTPTMVRIKLNDTILAAKKQALFEGQSNKGDM